MQVHLVKHQQASAPLKGEKPQEGEKGKKCNATESSALFNEVHLVDSVWRMWA